MAISEKDVEYIARLARLSITPEEKKLYQKQLGDILKHMTDLESLQTGNIPPTSSVLGVTDVLRDDKPRPFADAEKILAQAPEREGPCFKVPKIIE